MKMLSTLIITFATVAAMADVLPHPSIEAGPVQQIEDQSIEAMDAMLMASGADLKKFVMAGNTVNSATFQLVAPGITNYVFVRQSCMLGGITGGQCLGGAELQVKVTMKRAGSSLTKSAISHVTMIK